MIDQCFGSDNHSFPDILDSIRFSEFDLPLFSEQAFCTKVSEKKENCLIVCREHLIVILIATRKILCTSNDENTLVISSIQERYCMGCIKRYMRQMFSYFYFIDFEL